MTRVGRVSFWVRFSVVCGWAMMVTAGLCVFTLMYKCTPYLVDIALKVHSLIMAL